MPTLRASFSEWVRAHIRYQAPAPELEEAVRDVVEYLDERLSMGCCDFCGGNNEDGAHDEGCHCDVLKRALTKEAD